MILSLNDLEIMKNVKKVKKDLDCSSFFSYVLKTYTLMQWSFFGGRGEGYTPRCIFVLFIIVPNFD